MPHAYTEDQFVEQSAIGLFAEFGWATVSALSDTSGDTLDAILCAVQAAWSHRTSDPPHGIPADCDRLEGWIVDPGLLSIPEGRTT